MSELNTPISMKQRRASAVQEIQTIAADQAIPILIVSSVTILIAAASFCDEKECTKEYAYALAVGVVSLVFVLVYAYLERFQPATAMQVAFPLSAFLFLWWGIGACVFTFDAPFVNTGNGYFASWVGCCAATAFCYKSANAFHQQADQIAAAPFVFLFFSSSALAGQPVAGVFLASVVEMIAAAEVCDKFDYCKKELGFSVAVGTVSTFVCICMMLVPILKLNTIPPFFKWISLFLVVWWIPGVYINTFWQGQGVFQTTGNGYFATWAAFLFSVNFASGLWGDMSMPTLSSLASKKSSGAAEGSDLEAPPASLPVAQPVATPTEEKPVTVANPGVQADGSASAI